MTLPVWLHRLLGRSDVFDEEGALYMTRWRLVDVAWLGGIRVHRIVRSDVDREPHDHPFTFLSLILKGGYFEASYVRDGVTVDGDPVFRESERWFPPGSLIFRRAEALHRLTLPKQLPKWTNIGCDDMPPLVEREAWTLVITGPRRRVWGFQTDEGWISWRAFLEKKKGTAQRGVGSSDRTFASASSF